MDQKDENNLGMLCHLLAFSGFIIPFGGFIGPLVLWLMKKDESAFVDHHGREALNFQITMAICLILSSILIFVFIGLLLVPIFLIINVVFIIIASIAAQKGEQYTYPMTIRLIK